MIINNIEVSYLLERNAEEEYLMFSFSDTAKFIVSGKPSNYRFPLNTEYLLNMLQQFVDAVNYKDIDRLEKAIYYADYDDDICVMTKSKGVSPIIPDSFSIDSCEISIHCNPNRKPHRVNFEFNQNGIFLNICITTNDLIWFSVGGTCDHSTIAFDAGRLLHFLRMVRFATNNNRPLSPPAIKNLILESVHIMCDKVTIINDDTIKYR